MAWEVTIGGESRRVQLKDRGEGRWVATVDGVERELTIERPEDGLIVVVDGVRRRQAWLAERTGGYVVELDGRELAVDVIDERKKARLALGGAGAAGGAQSVSTSMPGKVVAVLVEVGQSVDAGDGVVVVEAMKMENELKASGPGVVSAILVEPGQAVEGGTVLVEIDPAEE